MDGMLTYQEFLYHTLFACIATLALAASAHLWLYRYNGIAPDIIPPLRLRRWTAAFFAAVGVNQLCWLFIYYSPLEGDLFNRALLCTALDAMLSAPMLLCTMFVMLQDRRRPLWPIFTASALYLIYLLVIYLLDIRSTVYLVLPVLAFFVIFGFVLLRAVRQYDRWLLDNYADLEHKEVRSNIGVLVAFILCVIAYSLANDYFFFEVFIEMMNILLIIVLLWRVETMQNLEESAEGDHIDATAESEKVDQRPDSIDEKLQSLLQQHCVEGLFYLRHDASLTQLAKLMGTNRTYLSKYFAQQGQTYNTYINNLRIDHFKRLYQEAVSMGLSPTATDLARQCGFRSYKAFGTAFKQICSQTVSEWMHQSGDGGKT